MRVCIYGTQLDRQMLVSAVNDSTALTFREYEADSHDKYESLLPALKENNYDLAIIMKDNADGMEGVIAIKSLNPNIPVIWFSNDKGFGAQSYRLNVTYFHEKPVTTQVLTSALASCGLI